MKTYDLMCVGVALVDSIIRGFDPNPVSASGYRATSGSLNVGGEAVNEAMAAAKAEGQLVFADTKLPNFRVLTLEDLRDSLPLIDYITPNEDEARYFSGKEEPEDMADVFLGCGVKNVIIKLGGKGCFFKNAEEALRLPAFGITAVDATGAGDNFVAGFASEILRGASHADALGFANACGAICTTAVGAETALKSREQVLELIADRR